MTSRLRIAAVTLVAAVGLFAAAGTAAAAPRQDDMTARHGEMKAHHEEMTARHEDRMARMAALDTRIELLTQQVNSFMGDARIDAMAALLTAVVEQNQAMRSAMTEMKDGMAAMMESGAIGDKAAPPAAPAHDHTGQHK